MSNLKCPSMSEEREMRIIGILLAKSDELDATGLDPEDFENREHRRIFAAIQEHKTGDLQVIGEQLGDETAAYALDLALAESFSPNMIVLRHYSTIVKQCSDSRKFKVSVSRLRPRSTHKRLFQGI